MLELVGALVAGILTTLAPCVLPLLPVVLGGAVVPAPVRAATSVEAVVEPAAAGHRRPVGVLAPATTSSLAAGAPWRGSDVGRVVVVTASLGASVFVFTLLLRASTALIGIPTQVWSWLSGGVLVGLGLAMALPDAWEWVSCRLALQGRAARGLGEASRRRGTAGAVATGAALGPVFTSCSPLYAYLVVTVLPASPARGLALLLTYVVGLCATLLVVGLAGQRVVSRLGWAVDPHGLLRRATGFVFVVVGVVVAAGWDRDVQTWIVENSPLRPWELDSEFVPAE
jgi:cytochrome c-type biogenesis protein